MTMIENNITQKELDNPLNEHLMYISEIKNKLIEAYEAIEDLYGYYEHNSNFANQIIHLAYKLEYINKDLNELFGLE
ncbi:hypothetical protein ACX9UE_000564 [Campylobacter upsaliensis]|nr:hypothetical protein [Campylobacter upsaliensis]EAI0017515.1 hypothetical protein [Campylobacter upsaliensis]EDP6884417.1 hypothetical protein [Campylobacter upsaliensis]ELS5287925.1 hypothetical protein [Campylobacter upsaliensis]